MNRGTAAFSIPILTLSDPKTAGEGVLDPLGLSRLADHLADWILPGMTARMIRPRFLTAIAVSAAVCDGLEEEIAADGTSPAYLVFEWLMLEGFARVAEHSAVLRTPGINKASDALRNGTPLSARSYLKTPTVFGFHGVYKRLARYLGIVDANLCLAENGHALLKVWEREQGLNGFVEVVSTGSPSGVRCVLRDAVRDGLKSGYTQRSGGWQGWSLFAKHLAPAAMGQREAEFVLRLLCSAGNEARSNEVFRVLSSDDSLRSVENLQAEADIYETVFVPVASDELRHRFSAIKAYEIPCTIVEEAFDWLRYLSSTLGARPLSPSEYVKVRRIKELSDELRKTLELAERAMSNAPPDLFKEFVALAKCFDRVETGDDLYAALLERHAAVQRAKQPDGKREWFEHGSDGSVFIRPAYRLTEPPSTHSGWGRPYRLGSVRSFCADLRSALS